MMGGDNNNRTNNNNRRKSRKENKFEFRGLGSSFSDEVQTLPPKLGSTPTCLVYRLPDFTTKISRCCTRRPRSAAATMSLFTLLQVCDHGRIERLALNTP
jgi:hypothetical protein